jgi:GNAT superfamily N-acetyltransferase
VRLASAADGPLVAGLLGESLADDPVTAWVFPDPVQRTALVPAFFRAVTDAILTGGDIYLHDDDGTMLVTPPGATEDADTAAAYAARLRTELAECAERALLIERILEAAQPAGGHCHRLVFNAVRPGAQGRGIGGAMLRHLTGRADEDKAGLYVECSTTRSLELVRQHGFAPRRPIPLPGGPSLYPALRVPRSDR